MTAAATGIGTLAAGGAVRVSGTVLVKVDRDASSNIGSIDAYWFQASSDFDNALRARVPTLKQVETASEFRVAPIEQLERLFLESLLAR